ncbi:Ferritin-like protein 2 [hydrothermal vent metagenome]|uniref:Ferritin-like protein 2 n=1 Tax=hydrothermal vent metagenome TaxID=652676 RepID=A0A3B0UXZ5_9ZZZZ
MFSERMSEAMAGQVNAEYYSAYLYLSMNSYLHSINLSGMANWMKMQTQEELFHGTKMYNFILERGGRVILSKIAQPPSAWDSPLAVFENAYAHERKVTGLINDLVDLAQEERDHATNIFLQWFISEQVEEEANASGIVHKLQLIGNDAGGLFALDQDLGSRVFTMPAGE